MKDLYKDHLLYLTNQTKLLLAENDTDTLILHAGNPVFYHADDQEVPFRTHAHFARFTPVTGPNHVLIIDQNEPLPLLLEFRPEDFWEEQIDNSPTFWREYLPTEIEKNSDELKRKVLEKIQNKKVIFIGEEKNETIFKGLGIQLENSQNIREGLDTSRSVKTPYEIACIEEATRIASMGHKKLQEMFLQGASEREMYYAYLESTNTLPNDLPYEPIIALNEKSATLHYRNKRNVKTNGSVLLVDAGVSVHGYASDITRTIATQNAHPTFCAILNDLEILQQKLCSLVKPGVEFIELHDEAHKSIARILTQNKIILCSPEEALEQGFIQPFFPHGLGHMLGLQVHDVGNSSKISEKHPLKVKYPRVRTNQRLEIGMVTTIEPGIYFIPLLLTPFRTNGHSQSFNWKLIDELIPYGGMRIEDNLVVTETGSNNLTRKYLP